MNMMNKTQTKELFDREAFLFGTTDGIPEKRAVELLGQEAVDFTHRMETVDKRGYYFNGYGNGPFTAYYMTLAGLYIAVTYNNVTALQKADEGAKA